MQDCRRVLMVSLNFCDFSRKFEFSVDFGENNETLAFSVLFLHNFS